MRIIELKITITKTKTTKQNKKISLDMLNRVKMATEKNQ